MAFESTSPNMNLILPGVGLTAGPQYASDLNASLTIIDSHNHAPGSGVQITPAGIDINTDLSFQNNSATLVKEITFQTQLSLPTDLDAIYVSGVDLWYNDGNGNQIQITSAGSVNAGSGSITGLVSPASATYISGSQSFVWQSNVNTAANMDMGSAILRNITAGSEGITLSPPSALASSYTITFPLAVPAANNTFLTMSTSGVISDNITVDGSTIQIIGNQITANIGPGSITGSQIAAHTITESNLELRPTSATATAGQMALSSSCGAFTSNATVYTDVTNLSISIVTTGRPVRIELTADGSNGGISADNAFIGNTTTSTGATFWLAFLRGGSIIAQMATSNNSQGSTLPPGSFSYMDYPAAGTYTYKVQCRATTATNWAVNKIKLLVYEI